VDFPGGHGGFASQPEASARTLAPGVGTYAAAFVLTVLVVIVIRTAGVIIRGRAARASIDWTRNHAVGASPAELRARHQPATPPPAPSTASPPPVSGPGAIGNRGQRMRERGRQLDPPGSLSKRRRAQEQTPTGTSRTD